MRLQLGAHDDTLLIGAAHNDTLLIGAAHNDTLVRCSQ